MAEKGLSLNLNSCPPVSPYSNPNNAAAAYEFGPFGTTGIFGPNQFLVDSKGSIKPQKRSKDDAPRRLNGDTLPRNPRKRVCRSNPNSSIVVPEKGNSNPNMETIVDNSKNVATDDIG